MLNPKSIFSLTLSFLMFGSLVIADSAPATAEEIMGRVRAAFPEGPLKLNAQMLTKTPSGKIEATYLIEIVYASTNETLSVSIKLSDAFGTPLEKVTAENIGSGASQYRYFNGEELDPAQMPPLDSQIADTDFVWQDLALSFLWWPNGAIAGMDSLKGRQCHIVDIPAPSTSDSRIRGTRLWIDAQMFVLLRAKFYDAENELSRRFDVKSFAKTDDLWMVKDIDIRTYPSRHRTVLRVRDVENISN